MGKKTAPPPPDVLRKSGPHKDRSKYDRKRTREQDRRDPEKNRPADSD
jgi:hypothetical protein